MTFKDLLNAIINGSDEERREIFAEVSSMEMSVTCQGKDENGCDATIRIYSDGNAEVETVWEAVPGATLVSVFRADGTYETDIPCFK